MEDKTGYICRAHGKKTDGYKILYLKPEFVRMGSTIYRLKNNILVDLEEILYEGEIGVHVESSQDTNKRQ
jgi:hypothetical protein